jgi:hypothetical protein
MAINSVQGHHEPVGQIAAREMKLVRIRGASEELSDDAAAALQGRSRKTK